MLNKPYSILFSTLVEEELCRTDENATSLMAAPTPATDSAFTPTAMTGPAAVPASAVQ